jgi:dihydroxyacetone kinase-like protein
VAITRTDISKWLMAFADAIAINKEYLDRLDAAIGDGDHGSNLERGCQAMLLKLPTVIDQDAEAIFKAVGMALVAAVGGASGPLYASLFIQMGIACAGKSRLSLKEWVAALEAGIQSMQLRGQANPGEKTMLDSLLPALEILRSTADVGASFADALPLAEQAAHRGMLATIPMVARKGSASFLAERSAGHQDPGATSAYMLIQAAAQVWSKVA